METSLNQALTRNARSRYDYLRLMLEHRGANKRFESLRQIHPQPLEELFPGISQARAVMQFAVPTQASFGNMQPYELIVLSTLCNHLKPSLMLEFGTYDGLTTLHLAMNSPAEARVVTLDLHPDDPLRQQTTEDTFYTRGVTVGAHFQDTASARKIEQVYCDTTKFDQMPYRGQVDFLFVDAGHAYELVRSDSEKALEMVRPGGVILWHDYHYTHDGVYTLLNGLAPSVPLKCVPNTTLVYHIGQPMGRRAERAGRSSVEAKR